MWICLKLVDIIGEEDVIYLASIFIFQTSIKLLCDLQIRRKKEYITWE